MIMSVETLLTICWGDLVLARNGGGGLGCV